MRLSDTYANEYLDFLLGKAAMPSPPKEVWLGLSSNAPESDGGTFNEITGNGYGRCLVVVNGGTYPNIIKSASARAIGNRAQAVWPKATGDYTVRGFGCFASETGGVPFAVGNIGTKDDPKTVSIINGALPMFEIDGLNINIPG